jgi:hypothetical protein
MKNSARQTSHPSLELMAEPVAQLVELFQQRAAQLKFPDVDAEALRGAQAVVLAQRDAVELAAVALDEARQELVRVELALLEKARQGHAYASVFASNDDELRAELTAIDLNVTERAPKKRRIMRPSASKAAKSARVAQGNSADLETASGRESAPGAAEEASVAAE